MVPRYDQLLPTFHTGGRENSSITQRLVKRHNEEQGIYLVARTTDQGRQFESQLFKELRQEDTRSNLIKTLALVGG